MIKVLDLSLLILLSVLPWTTHSLSAEKQPGKLLLEETFNQRTDTGLAKVLLAHRHIRLIKNAGPDGTDAIRVAYVGHSRGSQRVIARSVLESSVEEATLSFDVRFDRDFQWVLGGKLHGLGPENPVTGGNERHAERWSARIMFEDEGRCVTYLYDQNKTKKWGVGQTSSDPVFEAGKWHHVLLQIRLNAPDASNGFARIFIDNRKIIETKHVRFRASNAEGTRIQQFLFSTFHGGHSPEWAPVDEQGEPTTVYADFDNFEVREGIGVPTD